MWRRFIQMCWDHSLNHWGSVVYCQTYGNYMYFIVFYFHFIFCLFYHAYQVYIKILIFNLTLWTKIMIAIQRKIKWRFSHIKQIIHSVPYILFKCMVISVLAQASLIQAISWRWSVLKIYQDWVWEWKMDI